MGLTDSTGRRSTVARRPGQATVGWTLGLTSFAYFMVALDSLVVITALPSIQRDLHASVTTLQWTINAYGLTWAAGIITAAAIGDRFGRRRTFITGVSLFTVSSAACALAPNIGVLIAFRAIQGLGAAVILPLSLTILAGVFPPERRGTMIGIWGGIGGLAVACGPLVGGVLTQSLSWHWIFWLNVPIGLVVAVLSSFRIAESHGPRARLDLLGVVLITGGAVALIWSLVRTSTVGWGSVQTIGGLALGIVLAAAFVLWENRVKEPMLPMRLFRSRTFSAANATSFAMTGALLSAGVYLSQYFQFAAGASPIGAGLRLLPMMIMPLLVTPLSGLVSDRIGPRTLIVGGLLAECLGLAWFALIAKAGTGYGGLVIPLLLTGVGIAMALATTPTAALGSVPPTDMGKASGSNGTLQRFGGAFGVAVGTAAFAANGHLGNPASVASGTRAALLVSASLALLAAFTGLGIRTTRRTAAPAPAAAAPAVPVAVAVNTVDD